MGAFFVNHFSFVFADLFVDQVQQLLREFYSALLPLPGPFERASSSVRRAALLFWLLLVLALMALCFWLSVVARRIQRKKD